MNRTSAPTIVGRFEAAVRAFIKQHRLLRKGAPVIVALSGGADSVALLSVLLALGYDCRAAHCNFHLRGDESMRDMRHCRDLCRALDVDLYIRDFDVPARMAATGESVEMACRELRYGWFGELLDRDGAQALAVGHHREDRVETFVLNLMRGTGIAGLTAMQPASSSAVRPLLGVSRADIEAYLEARGLSWVNDSSNTSDAHRRNRVRNRVMPLLEELFPGAADAILRTIDNLSSARAIYDEAIESRRKKYIAADGRSIDVAALSAEPQAPTILLEFLRPLGFTFDQVCNILASVESSGQHFRSPDGATIAEQSRGRLTIADAATIATAGAESWPVSLTRDIDSPVRIAVSAHPVELFAPEGRGADIAYVDADIALAPNARWELRHYRRGDRMLPFGSTRSKLLSDIFANAKLDAEAKRRQWVLTCNGEIAWLPGLRNGAFASVGPETRRFIRLQLLKNETH